MTKRELEQYRSIAAEIREIDERIKSNTITDTVSGSDREYPYAKHTISIAGLPGSEYNRSLLTRKRKLERYRKRIEKYVDNIEDSLTRRIFRYRYIDGDVRPSWQWIAFKIGGGNTADGIRMAHKRFLGEND